jgi:hypothetical protein
MNSWCERWNIKINEWKTRAIYFPRRLRVPEDVLELNGRDIPFVNTRNATYLGVIFKRRITWKLHIGRIVAKDLRTYLTTYSLFKSERLSTNIKLTLYKALIRLKMSYACASWEYEADAHLLKLQCLQNRVLRATGNLDRRALVHEMNVTYVYDYITKLCRAQGEVMLNHRNPIVRGIGQGEAMHKV